MARVAIVIVTFNSGAEIGSCLKACSALPDVEIVVVDNASTDNTRAEIAAHGVTPIANPKNAGFAAAANQGVRATTAPLLCLLNPDAIPESGLDALIGEFDNVSVGAAGGMLTGHDGSPQRGFMARNLPTPAALILEVLGINRVWPGNPVNWHYRCFYLASDARSPVEQPAGAFLMFSRLAWEKVGGFDERFWPIWFEDVDFCAALKRAGFLVFYNPAARAKHTGAHSIRTLSVGNREHYWYGSLLEYAAKHFRSLAYRSVCCAVAIGAFVRGVAGFGSGGLQSFVVYGAVCRFAIGRLFGRRGWGSENTVV